MFFVVTLSCADYIIPWSFVRFMEWLSPPARWLYFAVQTALLRRFLQTLNEKTDGGDEIKVTFSGESEFESKLISLIRPGNRLSTINCICGFYENLPSADKTDIQDAVMSGKVFRSLTSANW